MKHNHLFQLHDGENEDFKGGEGQASSSQTVWSQARPCRDVDEGGPRPRAAQTARDCPQHEEAVQMDVGVDVQDCRVNALPAVALLLFAFVTNVYNSRLFCLLFNFNKTIN